VKENITLYAKWTEIPKVIKNPYRDVRSSDWYYENVMFMYEKGLMSGTAADMFSPDLPLTRAMIVTILNRLEGEPNAFSLANPFNDVAEGQWYTSAIKWAVECGIVQGYNEVTFGPNDNVTREQLAAILMRYLNFKEINLPVTTQYILFADESDIANYAMDAIQTLNKLGIINGIGTNSAGQTMIDPKGNAKRAQVAAMLHRLLELIEE